jgi:hypothetical protein
MTADQVAGLFDAGEKFIEGTIAAVLVVLWVMAIGLHLARPFMVRATEKFTLRLGADLWWIIYIGLRDILIVQVFLGSFIFFYPDVVKGVPLPITGSLAAACAFAVMLIKLTTKNDGDLRWFRWQMALLVLGATLYIVPYIFGVQASLLTGQHVPGISEALTTTTNTDLALPLCYISAALVGVMGLAAVVYNLRQTSPRPTAA